MALYVQYFLIKTLCYENLPNYSNKNSFVSGLHCYFLHLSLPREEVSFYNEEQTRSTQETTWALQVNYPQETKEKSFK